MFYFISLFCQNRCSTDPRVFPVFDKVPGSKSLQSRFQAFKFAEDPIVRFQVNVHFCLEECNPVICPGGTQSYGKRRRRQAEQELESENQILNDYELKTALLVIGRPFDNETGPTDAEYLGMFAGIL